MNYISHGFTLLFSLMMSFVIYQYRNFWETRLKLDYIILAYTIGLVFRLLLGSIFSNEMIQGMIYISVPLAMPLLIFKADFFQWLKQAPLTVKSFLIACFCTCLVGFLIGKYAIHSDVEKKIVAMLIGVFIGGTPNLNAIGLSLNVPIETIAIANTVDFMASGLYLAFMIYFAQPLLHKILPFPFPYSNQSFMEIKNKQETFFQKLLPIFLSVGILLIAIGLNFVIFHELKIPFVMLIITLLGILGSTKTQIRNLSKNEDYGNYLITVFCFSTGLILDIKQIFQHVDTLFVVSFSIVFISFFLQVIISRILRINPEIMMICSIACVMSPAFIPMFVKHFKNEGLLFPGITAGLAGFAVGNILGILLYNMIS